MRRSVKEIAGAALVVGLALGVLWLAQAADIVVTDASSILDSDDLGAVYRIPEPGVIETIASGYPLDSPSGVLFDRSDEDGDLFFVTDVGLFYENDDGAIFKVGDNREPVEIYSGAPLTSPFGMVRKGCCLLYVADFGSPIPGTFDGAVFEVNLDPDEDGEEGPYPVGPENIRTVISGDPLEGPNEMIWDEDPDVIMLADDSGSLYRLDLQTETVEPFGPAIDDPVGLGKLAEGMGYVVVDAADQEVYFIDPTGTEAVLMLVGTSEDQFLGVDSDESGDIFVANARDLFGLAADGEVIEFDDENLDIPYSGDPLLTPFAIELVE